MPCWSSHSDRVSARWPGFRACAVTAAPRYSTLLHAAPVLDSASCPSGAPNPLGPRAVPTRCSWSPDRGWGPLERYGSVGGGVDVPGEVTEGGPRVLAK